MVPAMNDQPAIRSTLTWRLTFQWIVAILVTFLLAGLTFSRNGWVPWLSNVDLGVHEVGHMLAFWAPTLLAQAADHSCRWLSRWALEATSGGGEIASPWF